MKTPEGKEITMLFKSIPVKDASAQWEVRLTFPAGCGPQGDLLLRATDPQGNPIAKADFEFAGAVRKIADGAGTVPCEDFIRGIHETRVWLSAPGHDPVPGGLTFG